MKLNYETCLSGEKVVLVPYRPEHVKRYHDWMKNPFLLEMTGSEPLSLEEEVKMQKSWHVDDEKCTFIVLSKELSEPFLIPMGDTDNNGEKSALQADFISNTCPAMIGDVNLFLSEEEDDDDNNSDDDQAEKTSQKNEPVRKQAELDLMIAEESCRGKGMGKEAACMMMIYGAESLKIRKFTVKINEENEASRHLFEKSLGFKECNYAACFKEYEFVFKNDTAEITASAARELLRAQIQRWAVPQLESDS